MQDARAFTFRNVAGEDGELLGRLITQLYSRTIRPPPEILVPCRVDDAELRAELLGELADRRVSIRTPQRGQGLRQLDVATRNARVRFDAAHSRAERNEQALFGLQKVLRLAELPRRIECYDNSNIQGQDPVGAMVTFQDGQPHKAGYRLFRIRGVEGADDYATMREVLGRRVERARSDPEGWGLPDLVVIDGGRGQLAMAVEACREAGVDVVSLDGRAIEPSVGGPLLRVIALAKPRADEETDKVYEPGRSNPISLRRRDPALQLLQAARDEAHRFGVSQHRKQRKKRTLRSDLDEVPGIGPTLRKRLLRHFGSMKQLRAASADELEAVSGVGRAKAKAISAALAAAKKGGLS